MCESMPLAFLFSVFIFDILRIHYLHFLCAESTHRDENMQTEVSFSGFVLGVDAFDFGIDGSLFEKVCDSHFVCSVISDIFMDFFFCTFSPPNQCAATK